MINAIAVRNFETFENLKSDPADTADTTVTGARDAIPEQMLRIRYHLRQNRPSNNICKAIKQIWHTHTFCQLLWIACH